MASQNVVFAIDVDYRPEETIGTTSAYQNHLKQWILRVLLRLGYKYGLEKVRWGYKFFHSRTVKSATLITRGSDFKELQEKVFSDFEEELLVKFSVEGKSPKIQEKYNKLKPSPASCVLNALKEILLDFQWDRPDLTSPTKVTLRPRRSSRSGRNIPLQDYDMLSVDKNVLFVVSECPLSKAELEDYLSIRRDDSRLYRDVHEQVLPKGLIDMLMQRKVLLHWADSGILKANHVVEDYTGMETLAELLGQVGGRVVPMLSPCLPLMDQHSDTSPSLDLGIDAFPIDSTNSYLELSERMHRQVFPPLGGCLSWIADGNRQSCSVTLQPVSCRQRFLRAPVDVILRGVLQDLDTISLSRSASESWIIQCTDAELGQEAFQHLKQLSTGGSAMLAEMSEGGVVGSAVLSVPSSCMAQLTVLQPLVSQEDQLLSAHMVPLDSTDISSDLPDVVSSVLNVMYAIMEDEDCADQVKLPFVPDWANQELKQGSCLRRNGLVEGWFPLSDQSGISCHLMESMRLLHAAPEEEEREEEYSDTQQEITSSLSELYQSSTAGSSGNLRSKKRDTQCTPVRQKMKTMSRSLQMLNFARLNVKAQKTQGDSSSAGSAKGAEKGGKRCSGDRTKPGLLHFSSEEELLSHLGLTYQKAVENRSVSVPSQVQDMLSVVKAFIKTNTDVEASFLDLVQKNLLKSCQAIHQLYGNSSDEESKIRACQLQSVLRLELCRQPEQQEDEEVVEQRVEDVADMLRIISRSKDAVYLSKFMQDEVLPVFLNSIPKVLADVYHSLGTQLPEALVAVLPSDFFSDESMAKDSVSVSPSPFSATQSNVSSVGDHLEELRNRSAKKRRQNMLTRHKSMTEAPQALRQIEMPRKSTRLAKLKHCVPVEKPAVEEPPPPKQAVQEVTKVRRNLFNQVAVSPSKKSKMPRSQSVSTVEGLKKRKRSHMDDDERHTLLTKKVSETPLHKQVSNRFLHRQRTGRSGESDVCIIEESPVKPTADLRRSPRIKSLTRRHSSVFYSCSQPRSRNLDRAIYSSQLCHSEGKGGFNVSSVRSPVRLLFGATQSPGRIRHTTASSSDDQGSKELSLRSAVFENQNKTPQKLRSDPVGSAVGCKTPRSPNRTVGENGMTLRGSPFRSPAAKSLVVETPKKSPLKGILKTPMKNLLDCVSPNGAWLRSPNGRTPKKNVTWSPSPRKRLSENPINVPESPMFTKRCSPRLLTPGKNSSPEERNVFKTPDKVPQRKSKASPGTMPRTLEILGNVDPETSQSITRSGKMRRTLSLLCKITEKSGEFASIDSQENDSEPFSLCASPLKPNIQTPVKSPSLTHRMCTRSGRTPLKESSSPPNKSRDIAGSSPLPHKGLSAAKLSASPSSGPPRSRIYHQCSSPTSNIGEFPQDNKMIGQNEINHGKAEETSPSDSQQFDCSEFSITTDDESIDISEASVVKTQLTGGIKMNIAFSRKPSRSSKVFEFKGKQATPAITTTSRSYGFRQTPDRRQREAEARLGYSSGTPKIYTPRTRRTPACGKKSTPQPLTYEVEMEMQASGLPKLKLRRTNSFNAGEAPSSANKGVASHIVHRNMSNVKAPQVDSPLAQCSRHPGCISPSLCSRGTPAKGTPGKGVQTYICQSITPTHYPASSQSPLASPLTPSPQSRGWSTPENLNSWPRKKRARIEACGSKEQVIKGVPLLEKPGVLENPELEGVFRIQGVEELKESLSTPVSQRKLGLRSSQVIDHQCSPEDMDWTETVVQDRDARDPTKSEQFAWMGRKVDTPKVKKPVSASGIFALTQSPLLYKKSTAINEATQLNGSKSELDISPLCQSRRRRTPSRTYSRKKLLD
ncbi:treslin-like isoform X2 [Sinocyclocheilus rhinocerous]|uniref:treslin-like isoform X2 n=1 Tax=Sinocyclocheilus rhinocerous TaxID=307959 RepID=UPI0007B97650|nr:PREDICTED: treslin-like isoform X2 [Sinocyclocheilus rhinocerous]